MAPRVECSEIFQLLPVKDGEFVGKLNLEKLVEIA